MRANRQIALQNAGMFHVKHQARKGHRSARGAVPQRTPFPLYRAAAHSNMAHANAARRRLQRPVLGELPFPPLAQRLQHGNKALAARCEAVLHARRHLAEVVT